MKAPDAAPRTLRRKAWELAQLDAADRDWILSQLTEQERVRLQSVTDEVLQQGGAVQAADGSARLHALPAPGTALARSSTALARSSVEPQQLQPSAALISDLPDWLAQRVMLALPPADRARVLSEMDRASRRAIERLLQQAGNAPAMTELSRRALLDCVAQQQGSKDKAGGPWHALRSMAERAFGSTR